MPMLIVNFPQTDGSVAATLIYKGVLYIGGNFTTVTGPNGTFSRKNLAAIDMQTYYVLPWDPQITTASPITDIVAVGNAIYFSSTAIINTAFGSRSRMAAFSTDGSILPWAPSVNDAVRTLATDGLVLYAGGDFTTATIGVNIVVRERAAAFDLVSGDATPWNPDINARVLDILPSGGKVYVVGEFTLVNGATGRNYAAAFDNSAGTVDASWIPDPDDKTGFLAQIFNQIIISGVFTFVNGGATARNKLAQVDAVTGAVQTPDLSLTLGASGIVVHASKLYVLGSFGAIAGQARPGKYAVYDFSAAQLEPASLVFSGGNPVAMSFVPVGYVFGGTFSTVEGETHVSLAAFLDPTPGLPQAPVIEFLNRKTSADGSPTLTLFKWKPVVKDVNNNYINVNGYRVYRTTSMNLEDPVLIAQITSLDIRGFIDTMFTERIDGFYKYCVSAFNDAGEGGKSCASGVGLAQSDRVG